MIRELFESSIRFIGGRVGIGLRRIYYRMRLKKMGRNVRIGEGVYFDNPAFIEIGDHVWIDRNCVLIGGKLQEGRKMTTIGDLSVAQGIIRVGSFSHIGIGTIIQGHGGVSIGSHFTTSANCKIYSVSNIPQETHHGTIASENYTPPLHSKTVSIGNNVWLGLNVAVISTRIGDDTFVMPNALVYKELPSNCIAAGSPAVKMKDRFEK